jgi:hypothetical protein
MASTKKVFIDIRVADKASRSVDRTKRSVDDLAASTRNFTSAQKDANEEIQKGATSAGLAGAIVTEFGRTVSDLPFGFTAVANNISQLFSLVGLFFANTARAGLDTKDAFKELKNQFLGPVGLITLFQIFITILQNEKVQKFISSIFQLSSNLQLLRDILPSVNKNAESLVGNFKIYTDILADTTRSQEQKTLALEKLNEQYPDFNANTLVDANNNLEAADAIDIYIESLKKKAIAQAAQDKIQELSGDIIEKQFEQEIKLGEAATKFNQAQNEVQFKSLKDNLVVTQEEKVKSYGRSVELINDETESFVRGKQEEIDFYMKFVSLDENTRKKNKQNVIRDRKEFRRGRLALERIEESFRQKSIDQSLKTEGERIKQAEEFSKREIDIRVEAFTKTQKVRLDNYVKDIQSSKLSEDRKNELITAANRDFNNSILDAQRDADAVKLQIEAATQTELKLLSDERREAVIDNIAAMREAERELGFSKEDLALKESFLSSTQRERLEFTREQVDLTIEQTDAEKARLQSQIDTNDRAIRSTKDRLASGELTKEQQDLALVALSDYNLRAVQLDAEYTAASDKNADARIKIAQAEANAKVQAFQVTADALNAFAKLAGEDTKAGKALAVSGALISTYLSAQKAFESQFKPLATVDSPVRGAIAAAAAVATGLANVKAILSVDPNGESGTKSAPPAPAFNVVGTSVSNQLLDTISGQLGTNGIFGGEPIKAYVVGSEVTNQQAMDRQTEQGASLFS